MDSEAAKATVEAMKDVMRFWMDRGCDGFRVDMAASLVKGDDEQKTGTSKILMNIRKMLDEEYPECALVSEWGHPDLALKCGFHMDFMLDDLRSPVSTLNRDYKNHTDRMVMSDSCFTGAENAPVPDYEDHSFFRMDAGGDICDFMDYYLKMYESSKDMGYISMISCNHDTVRPSFNMTPRELKLFYAFLFTMPGVPFMYYGDEIGLRYQNLRTKEGGYFRTGSRTPMQWSRDKNLGFSEAEEDRLYLPVDPSDDAPVVSEMLQDEDSLLNCIKSVLKLRHADLDLQSAPNFSVLYMEKKKLPFVYQRGNRICAVNTSSKQVSISLDKEDREVIWQVGSGKLKNHILTLAPQSFVIL